MRTEHRGDVDLADGDGDGLAVGQVPCRRVTMTSKV